MRDNLYRDPNWQLFDNVWHHTARYCQSINQEIKSAWFENNGHVTCSSTASGLIEEILICASQGLNDDDSY